MAFLVNFRLRSDSDRPESEASPTENGACAFKVKSAGSQKAFHFSTLHLSFKEDIILIYKTFSENKR